VIKWILLFASIARATADLVAPFTVDVISSKHPLWDTIQITTYLSNIGTTSTISNSSEFTVLNVGIDSLMPLRIHNILPTYYLGAGNMVVYKDTITALRGPFAIVTHADPIHVFQEYSVGNDVRSQAYNFHPAIQQIHDTVVVYDTVRVTVRDTIRDTIRVGPPALAKAASAAHLAPVASVVYDAAGAKVWEGMLPPGAYPPTGLRPGLHLIVQGEQARRFRIAYR
jgi:hypothetical protein